MPPCWHRSQAKQLPVLGRPLFPPFAGWFFQRGFCVFPDGSGANGSLLDPVKQSFLFFARPPPFLGLCSVDFFSPPARLVEAFAGPSRLWFFAHFLLAIRCLSSFAVILLAGCGRLAGKRTSVWPFCGRSPLPLGAPGHHDYNKPYVESFCCGFAH